ncbi:MAG: P1 family peptidase [Nitrospirae bacterium]|nr:P1 family peptidase [Nitrospirota bacterium]
MRRAASIAILLLMLSAPAAAERARELGIPFAGTPGPLNAITDVPGVRVGHATLIHGQGGDAARTGVTAILPLGPDSDTPVPAAGAVLNGNGDMTGTQWLAESGFLEGPVVLTNTHSVGVARDAVVAWGQRHFPGTGAYSLPVVAETWDGYLNAINAFHVRPEHVWQALDSASGGPPAEGSVGGGTGMMAYRFKAGIGTSSRLVAGPGCPCTVGVLVQANYGQRDQLVIAGVAVGREIPDLMPTRGQEAQTDRRDGSIVAVIATDAPLLPHQLGRLARRVPIAIGRLGGIGANSSGDLFVAFSTRVPQAWAGGTQAWSTLPNDALDPLFSAVADATEEAIVNALVAADDMTGVDGNTVYALPERRLLAALRKWGRVR